jgi:integrase
MNHKKLTDTAVQHLRPAATRYVVWDGTTPAFGVRVGTTGRKSFVGMYRFDGKARMITYGAYGTGPGRIGLAKARALHAAAMEKVEQGTDPGAARVVENAASREAHTVAALAQEYLEQHARKRKKGSSADEDERQLNCNVLPAWGQRKAKDITRRDVIELLDNIEARGAPVARNRTAALLSKLFRVGMDRGVVETSPAVGVSRLPEVPRDVLLTAEQIRSLWQGLDKPGMDRRTALAIKFCLVTGQRRAEVAGTALTEIDSNEDLWHLPAARTKNGRENYVPLPPLAVAIIAEADALRVRPVPTRPNRKDRPAYDATPSIYLFPSRVGKKPLEPAALTRALNRNREALSIGGATVHDLRRVFATAHGELGTPLDILRLLLNHAPTTVTEKHYNLARNLEPCRRAMEIYCAWLERVVTGASRTDDNVIDLATRRRTTVA